MVRKISWFHSNGGATAVAKKKAPWFNKPRRKTKPITTHFTFYNPEILID